MALIIIEIVLDIIIWSISLSLDNNIYKMRENIFLHEIIKKNSILVIIILTTFYLVYLIIKFLVILCEDDSCKYIKFKYKIIIPIYFIFEYYLNIFILIILPKSDNYRDNYFQKVYYNYSQKYGYNSSGKDFYEFESLQALNKAFLSFIIIVFIFTFIKLIATLCIYM